MQRDEKNVSALPCQTGNIPTLVVGLGPPSIVGQGIKALREELGLSQEKVGVAIGIDESSSRARISRYELGVHEPPVPTARLIADALGVPSTYLYREDDKIASLLLALHRLGARARDRKIDDFMGQLAAK